MGLLSRLFQRNRPSARPGDRHGIGPPPRMLFLDDDATRAGIFLAENPHAVWVQTAADCIAQLEEPWEEVHLDHDLGGEHFVDDEREDCGMEVVRWLCLIPRPHLRRTRFYVHSHNPAAATNMGMQLLSAGFFVELRPFGSAPLPPLPSEFTSAGAGNPLVALVEWLRRRIRREPARYDFSDLLSPRDGAVPDLPPLERLDLDWVRTDAAAAPPGHDEPQRDPGKLDLSWATPPPPPSSPPPEPPTTGS